MAWLDSSVFGCKEARWGGFGVGDGVWMRRSVEARDAICGGGGVCVVAALLIGGWVETTAAVMGKISDAGAFTHPYGDLTAVGGGGKRRGADIVKEVFLLPSTGDWMVWGVNTLVALLYKRQEKTKKKKERKKKKANKRQHRRRLGARGKIREWLLAARLPANVEPFRPTGAWMRKNAGEWIKAGMRAGALGVSGSFRLVTRMWDGGGQRDWGSILR